jgi:hypothetical protein
MIINVIHKINRKLHLITVDLRIHQIRYLTNPNNHGPIDFYDIGQTNSDCYKHLFNLKYDKPHRTFLETLAEDVSNNFQCIKSLITWTDLSIKNVVNPE